MLDRLDQAFRGQRQLIDDASHELRSALAIIRTHLDATLTDPDTTAEQRGRTVSVIDRATDWWKTCWRPHAGTPTHRRADRAITPAAAAR